MIFIFITPKDTLIYIVTLLIYNRQLVIMTLTRRELVRAHLSTKSPNNPYAL